MRLDAVPNAPGIWRRRCKEDGKSVVHPCVVWREGGKLRWCWFTVQDRANSLPVEKDTLWSGPHYADCGAAGCRGVRDAS